MRMSVLGLALALSVPALAQDQAAPMAAATVPAIPAMTPVDIEILDAVSSKTNKPGDMFRIRLAEPIEIDGKTVVPAGVEGQGEVVHAAKARAAGKPGELILAARYLDWNGARLPLRSFGYGKAAGKDRVDTAFAVAVGAGSVFALFVSGGQIEIPVGTRANAKLSAAVALPTLSPPSP